MGARLVVRQPARAAAAHAEPDRRRAARPGLVACVQRPDPDRAGGAGRPVQPRCAAGHGALAGEPAATRRDGGGRVSQPERQRVLYAGEDQRPRRGRHLRRLRRRRPGATGPAVARRRAPTGWAARRAASRPAASAGQVAGRPTCRRSTCSRPGSTRRGRVDFWGRVRREVESADANIDASAETRRDMLVTVLSEVARDYIQLRGQQRDLQIAKDTLASERDSLRITQERQSGGLTTGLDVANASAQVGTTAAQTPAAGSAGGDHDERDRLAVGGDAGCADRAAGGGEAGAAGAARGSRRLAVRTGEAAAGHPPGGGAGCMARRPISVRRRRISSPR